MQRPGDDVTVVAWGMMARRALEAAARLEEEGISVEVLDPRTLHPLDFDAVYDSIGRTGRLVVVEMATAMVLLVGAALLGQSLYRLLQVDLGFEPARLVTLQVAAVGPRFENRAMTVRLGREVVSAVSALPGVAAAAITSVPPVSFNGNTDWVGTDLD